MLAMMQLADDLGRAHRRAPARTPAGRPAHRAWSDAAGRGGPHAGRGRRVRRPAPVRRHRDDDEPHRQRRRTRCAPPPRRARPAAGRRAERIAARRRGDAALGVPGPVRVPPDDRAARRATASSCPSTARDACSSAPPTATRAQWGDDAAAFDPDRDTAGHIAFGFGPHFCLGAALARAETASALRHLLPTLTGAPIDDGDEWIDSLQFRGRRRFLVDRS